MKFIRNLLEKVEPIAAKNKFAHAVYDGIETFLFQPKYTTKQGVHIRDGMDLKRTMIHVVMALQVCYIIGTYNMGHQHFLSLGIYNGLFEGFIYKLGYGLFQLLPIFIVAHVVGLGIEFYFAARKGHSIEEGFLVSGALIPLIMPPDIPLWMVAVSTAFAVLIAKEAFGGTGMNILNIALTARVFIFFAYPGAISGDDVWVAQDYNVLQKVTGIEDHANAKIEEMMAKAEEFGVVDTAGNTYLIDGFSGATPLALAADKGWEPADSLTESADIDRSVMGATYTVFDEETGAAKTVPQYTKAEMFFGIIPGSIGETSKLGVLMGALILLLSGIGSWRIMFSMILGCVFAGTTMNLLVDLGISQSPFLDVPWYDHFLMGSFFFAMAFMATDPVTASGTNQGKLIYGFLIGVVGMIVRVLNPAYPEGWMLAILFMNVFAPLIDHVVLSQNIKRRMSHVVQ